MGHSASRILRFAFAIASAGLLAAPPVLANCGGGIGIFFGFSSTGGWWASCGDDVNNVRAFFWEQHFASQGTGGANSTSLTSAGIDSGALSGVADFLIAPYDTTGAGGAPTPGAYQTGLGADWGAFGPDGCPLLKQEPDPGACPVGTTTSSMPVTNWVITGRDLAAPLTAKASVISVDMDELYQIYILDQATAPAVDGNPCGGDASSFRVTPSTCGTIPIPAILSSGAEDSTGVNLTISVPPHSVPIEDDCNVAFSKAIDCPRNLYVGRQIFIRRAPCGATSPANAGSFDTRTYAMDSQTTFPGTITPVFVPYAPQDLNLNGIQDAGESPFTPVILAGNSTAVTTIHIPRIAGATDCAYLGVALVLDSAPDPTACGGAPCQSVVTPLVSVDRVPVSLDTATPVGDKVINLAASRAGGKASVSWDTTAEFQTAGFNLIGAKRNGGEVRLNATPIPAKEGTTGQGASYSVALSGGDLKGSAAVYVEVVKTNGTTERFGPASF